MYNFQYLQTRLKTPFLAKDKVDRKPLCFAFLVLIDADGAAISDETHTLPLYKVPVFLDLPKLMEYLNININLG